MAKILGAGGRIDSVTTAGTVTEVTTAGTFDSSYADCAMNVTGGGGSNHWTMTFRDTANAAVDVVTGETLYCHAEINIGGGVNVSASTWFLLDSSNQPWLALRSVSATTFGVYYNSGTGGSPTWTLLGSTFTLSGSTRYALDIKLTLGSPHSVEFSIDGTASVSTTFTQASLTALRAMRGFGAMTSTAVRWSQLMATEGISTIGGKVRYSRPTAAGTNSAWTGAYTNVNEAVDNTAVLDSTTAANNKQTYAMGDVTVPAGYVIKAVFHALYAKNDGAAPTNIKSVLRSGGTDYVAASNLAGIGTSFASLIERYDNDPATATTFTQSGFNALEAGYRSET